MAVMGAYCSPSLRPGVADGGGFSPLRGFMTPADYEGVCHKIAGQRRVVAIQSHGYPEQFAKSLKPGAARCVTRAEG